METDWAQITDAWGPASLIPRLLNDLDSPDHDIQGQAIDQLSQRLCMEDTRYEAAAHAVPRVLDSLLRPQCTQRIRVFQLFASLVLCEDLGDFAPIPFDSTLWFEDSGVLNQFSPQQIRLLLDNWDYLDVEYVNAFSARWSQTAYDAGAKRAIDLIPLMYDKDERIACKCMAILPWFPTVADHATEAILKRLQNECTTDLRTCANLCLGFLSHYTDKTAITEHLTIVVGGADEVRERVAGAVAACHALHETPPSRALEILQWYRENHSGSDPPSDYYPWYTPMKGLVEMTLDELHDPSGRFWPRRNKK